MRPIGEKGSGCPNSFSYGLRGQAKKIDLISASVQTPLCGVAVQALSRFKKADVASRSEFLQAVRTGERFSIQEADSLFSQVTVSLREEHRNEDEAKQAFRKSHSWA